MRFIPIDVQLAQEVVGSSRWVVTEDGECILWDGYCNEFGYGRLRLADGSLCMAHRLAWVAANGCDIPEGLTLDHLCRNPSCVNSDHLEPVTLAENTRRGEAPAASNLRKTSCPEGHLLEPGNLVLNKLPGRRSCLTCHRERAREQRVSIRLAAKSLGITWTEYVAEYGYSTHVAQSVLGR